MTTEILAEVIREARRCETPVRIRAKGTWLDAGWPTTGVAADISALRGIVEYNPGDLTLTALAGTPLDEIRSATAAHGQWLALDPWGRLDGSLGATLATASYGPLGGSIGLPRDVVLGIEFITGEGVIARAGGRVVKNVTGFDLTRLMVGAWGTLGIITEATVRLRARPDHDVTLRVALPSGRGVLHDLLRALRSARLEPIAVELVNGTLAHAVGAGDEAVLLLRCVGNAAAVKAQRDTVATLAPCEVLSDGLWDLLAVSEPSDASTFRVSTRPTGVALLWETVQQLLPPAARVHATVERGVVRCVVPHGEPLDLRSLIDALPHPVAVVGERLPPSAWSALPSPADDRLSRDVRQAFDPARVLNRGILGVIS